MSVDLMTILPHLAPSPCTVYAAAAVLQLWWAAQKAPSERVVEHMAEAMLLSLLSLSHIFN